MLDIGLLVVRVLVGLLLLGHGARKLFGWFGGPGPGAHASFIGSLGYRRPTLLSRLHAVAETGAGLLLALGLLTPLAIAAILAVMVNAIVAVHRRNGLWVTDGGFEYPLVLPGSARVWRSPDPGPCRSTPRWVGRRPA